MKNANETYQHSIRNYFSFLKSTTRLDDLYTKSVPLDNHAGYLLPVSALHANDAPLIEKLAAWRKAHTESFPSQFQLEKNQFWVLWSELPLKGTVILTLLKTPVSSTSEL